PDSHGIVNNEFLDRERGLFKRDADPSWLRREPPWATAERQGGRAAAYHWVCSGRPGRGVAPPIRVPCAPGPPEAEPVDRPGRRLLAGAAPGARAIGIGGTANIYCSRPAACGAPESILSRAPGLTVYRRDELPPDLHYRLAARSGDLVAIAPPGTYFADREPHRGPPPRGMHGYRPDDPEMRGIFYAWGAGIRKGSRHARVRGIAAADQR